MMCDPDLKCGVLTDFDLFILQWEPRVIETDRTDTIPCMAIDQLTCTVLSNAYTVMSLKLLSRSFLILAYCIKVDFED
jgi:hypothetical protein